jgi:hypothetical protein
MVLCEAMPLSWCTRTSMRLTINVLFYAGAVPEGPFPIWIGSRFAGGVGETDADLAAGWCRKCGGGAVTGGGETDGPLDPAAL